MNSASAGLAQLHHELHLAGLSQLHHELHFNMQHVYLSRAVPIHLEAPGKLNKEAL
ncbi:hypothetical protein A2U01_0069885 [Trifolium medium]|uniref:Uncharacterized protein n=1 Tax=Trifolium medium TaxID=97028 RepID=A0A392SJM7_9FABA|nr:hypothetical protein [Trifolium medium]